MNFPRLPAPPSLTPRISLDRDERFAIGLTLLAIIGEGIVSTIRAIFGREGWDKENMELSNASMRADLKIKEEELKLKTAERRDAELKLSIVEYQVAKFHEDPEGAEAEEEAEEDVD